MELSDLLKQLRGVVDSASNTILKNTRDVWSRLGRRDKINELGDDPKRIKDWIDQNPYSNIED